jgi:hypothetical protein
MSRARTEADLVMAEAYRMTGRDPDAGLSIPDLLSTATSLLPGESTGLTHYALLCRR